MDVLRPLSTGVSSLPPGSRGTPLRTMHQHPGSKPLYLIKTTNTPSTLKPTSFCSHRIPRIHQEPSPREGCTLVTRSRRRGVLAAIRGGRRDRKRRGGGWIPWRSREVLLMPRGQRDGRTLGKRRPVDLYLSSSRLAAHRTSERRKTLIRARKAHAAI